LHPGGRGIVVETHGEGEGKLANDATNLTVAIMREELGADAPTDFRIVCHNAVPAASGLGSSSTATLAGVIFAHAWQRAAKGEDPAEIDREAVLARAVAIEGHGDNVAPALLGGFVIVVPDEKAGVLVQRVPHLPLKAVVCVPEFNYLTSEARAALPATYSKADAIYNIGRAMLVAEALRAGDDEMLRSAMNDRIHEPYRLGAVTAALEAGATCVALSGAGPGMIAFARGGYDRIGRSMKEAFAKAGLVSRYWILDATDQGTHIGRLPV
jgi:homoserine kinase